MNLGQIMLMTAMANQAQGTTPGYAQNLYDAWGQMYPNAGAYPVIQGVAGGTSGVPAKQAPQGFTFPVGQLGGYKAPTYNWQAQLAAQPQAQAAPVQSFSNMLYGGQAPRPQWQQPNFAAMFQPQKGVMK